MINNLKINCTLLYITMKQIPPEIKLHICQYVADVCNIWHLFGFDFYKIELLKRLSLKLCCANEHIDDIMYYDDFQKEFKLPQNKYSVFQITRGAFMYEDGSKCSKKTQGLIESEYNDLERGIIHNYRYISDEDGEHYECDTIHIYTIQYFILSHTTSSIYGYEYDTLGECLRDYHKIKRKKDFSQGYVVYGDMQTLSWDYTDWCDSYDHAYTALRVLVKGDQKPCHFKNITSTEYHKHKPKIYCDYMDQGFYEITQKIDMDIIDFNGKYVEFINEEGVYALIKK